MSRNDGPNRTRADQETIRHASRLKSGQIGLLGLTALAVGAVSPALGLFALWAPIETAAGPVAPLVFAGAALLSLPTAISYAVLNREIPSAGAASTWLWRAVSPAAGYLVGLTMMTYFILIVCTMPLLFALFFRDLMDFIGVPDFGLPTLLVAIPIVTLPVMWLAYRGAEVSTRAAVTLMSMESMVVLALSLTILYSKASVRGGIELSAFNPMFVTHGFRGYWTAMLLGILAYAGFDVVSTAAEETHAPRDKIPKAIMLTIFGVTAFWVLNAWAFTLGMPYEMVDKYSAHGVSAVTPLALLYWGRGRLLVILSAFTGIFAVYITAALGTSRIIFALARHGLMPRALVVLKGSRRVPIAALHTVFGIAVVADMLILLLLRNGVAAFTWCSNVVVFFACVTFIGVNIANLVYFRRIAKHRFNWLTNGIVPVVGITLTAYVLYESFFVALWGVAGGTGRSIVFFSVILFLAFILNVTLVASISPKRLQGHPPFEAE
jgi:amino acid transporter